VTSEEHSALIQRNADGELDETALISFMGEEEPVVF